MRASWSYYTVGLGGVGVDGPAVWAVGSMGDCNQLRDGAGVGVREFDWAGRWLVVYKATGGRDRDIVLW